jgi:hypothetical protein
MSNTDNIQATEEQTLSGNQQAALDDSQLTDNANGGEGQDEGFDIVLSGDETEQKQDPATNAKFAQARIERKRQRELEQQLEAVRRGEVPETLRVNPDLPPQPDINQYLSEESLEKYGYDQTRALAAFSQANNEWLIKAQDARSNAVAEQGRKTQEYTQQSTQTVEAVRKHYDAAEKLNLPDYQEKEDYFRSQVPEGVDTTIMNLFPEKSAAIMYHLGANPEKLRHINSLSGQQALIELARLDAQLTIKPRGKQVSKAPPADEAITTDILTANKDSLKSRMDKAAKAGETDLYRKLKAQYEGMK